MDPATIAGLLIAFGALYGMVALEGASVSSLLLPAPMLLVLVGTIAVGVASSTMKDVLHAVKSLPKAFTGKPPSPETALTRLWPWPTRRAARAPLPGSGRR